MYHLVIGSIAIAIGAAVTFGGVWYGGPIYATAKARADFAAIEMQAQQIASALTYYEQENVSVSIGEDAAALAHLQSGGYLKAIPPGEWWIKSTTEMWRPVSQQDVETCSAMNKLAGHDAVCPPCDSQEDKKYPVCQQTI